jgi:hypothetical protein
MIPLSTSKKVRRKEEHLGQERLEEKRQLQKRLEQERLEEECQQQERLRQERHLGRILDGLRDAIHKLTFRESFVEVELTGGMSQQYKTADKIGRVAFKSLKGFPVRIHDQITNLWNVREKVTKQLLAS